MGISWEQGPAMVPGFSAFEVGGAGVLKMT